MISAVSSYSGSYDTTIKHDMLQTEARDVVKKEYGSLSFSKSVWRKIDQMFDMGSSKDLLLNDLSSEEKEQYYKITAALLKKGIIGWRYYEINGQIEKHFLVTSIGDQRLSGGEQVRWRKPEGYY